MQNLQQSRMQAAIELLGYMMAREIEKSDDKYKHLASLGLEDINRVLLVAGAGVIDIGGKDDNK